MRLKTQGFDLFRFVMSLRSRRLYIYEEEVPDGGHGSRPARPADRPPDRPAISPSGRGPSQPPDYLESPNSGESGGLKSAACGTPSRRAYRP